MQKAISVYSSRLLQMANCSWVVGTPDATIFSLICESRTQHEPAVTAAACPRPQAKAPSRAEIEKTHGPR